MASVSRTLSLILALVSSLSDARAQALAPEPAVLWPGPMQGATPQTLKGASVIDAPTLAALIARQAPVLIDVANLQHRPEGRVPGLNWFPVHRSIPGATWMPGAGSGKDAPGFADAFAARIETATGSDKDRPIVTFCHPRRWGSWNAAKRLTALGYRHVYWYPGGGEGWGAQGNMKAITEDPRWKAGGFDKSSASDLPEAGAATER